MSAKNVQNILRNIILGGLFLLPFIPFIVPNAMFFPFITGKGFAFRVIVEIIFVAWVALAILSPLYRPARSSIFLALSAFVGVMFLAALFGEDIIKSIWSNYERMMGWVTLAHLWALFAVVASVLRTEKLWHRLFQVSLGASAIMGIYGMFQLAGLAEIHQGSSRLDGSFGNATYLAVYALFHVFLAAFLAIRTQARGWMLAVYSALALLNVFILLQTATRGAILGLFGGALLTTLLIAIFGREYPSARKWAGGILAVLILFVGGFIAIKDTNFAQESSVFKRFADIGTQDLADGVGTLTLTADCREIGEKTLRSRCMVWQMAGEGIAEEPLLGYGQGNFGYVFNQYYNPYMYDQEPFFDRAHNVIMDWLVAGGILGLLAYLSILFFAFFYIWRRNSLSLPERSILTGLLAAYFFQNLFVFDNVMSYTLFIFVLGYIHMLGSEEKEVSGSSSPQIPAHAIAAAALVGVFLLVYFVNADGYRANKALLNAIRPYESGVEQNLENFKLAHSYDSFAEPEINEQLVKYAARAGRQSSISQSTKQEFVGLAQKEMGEQIADHPNNVRYRIIMSSLYSSLGAYEQAEAHLAHALELSPTRQALYAELITTHINRDNTEKALELAKASYELAPENENAVKVYAVAAVYAGEMELARDLLMETFGTMAVDDDKLVKTYSDAGRYDLVIEIWQKRIEENHAQGEENIQHHISLAATYLRSGQPQQAIAEVEYAMEQDSRFEQQGQHIINMIREGRGAELLQ